MNEDLDDLDQALFALPLDVPPAGMREAILRSTVYASMPSPLAFTRWEIAGIGAALALGTWLVLLAFWNHAFAAMFATNVYEVARAFGAPTTLAWLATGSAVVVIATFANFKLPRLPVRSSRP
jgi:hypothetical protein